MEYFDGFFVGDFVAGDGEVFVDDPAHFLFDFFKVGVGDMVFFKVKVLVKTFVGPGADAELYVWGKHFYGGGHDVAGGVTALNFWIGHGDFILSDRLLFVVRVLQKLPNGYRRLCTSFPPMVIGVWWWR